MASVTQCDTAALLNVLLIPEHLSLRQTGCNDFSNQHFLFFFLLRSTSEEFLIFRMDMRTTYSAAQGSFFFFFFHDLK